MLIDPKGNEKASRICINKKQNSTIEELKQLISFDGSYIPLCDGISMKVLTGSLSTKNYKNKTCFILSITSFSYIINEFIEKFNYESYIDFSNPLAFNNSWQKCFILRLDHGGTMVAIGLNSTHKYHCQVLLLSLTNGYGILH